MMKQTSRPRVHTKQGVETHQKKFCFHETWNCAKVSFAEQDEDRTGGQKTRCANDDTALTIHGLGISSEENVTKLTYSAFCATTLVFHEGQ